MLIFSVSAIICYLISLGLIVPGLLRKNGHYQKVALVAAVIAMVLHAVTLQQRIFEATGGQNISLLNIASIISLIICIAMTIVASRNRGWLLLPIVYSFAIINVALASFMPWEVIAHLEDKPKLLTHIALALFSYATLMIAALYALQLMFIDHQLKNKKLYFSPDMPPLMVIEKKLFHIIQIGFGLLTLTLFTGFLYMDNLLGRENAHKTVFSIIAWCVYAVLLWGHYQQGWRGNRVVWFSLAGAGLLTLGYFGSRLIQYLIYH